MYVLLRTCVHVRSRGYPVYVCTCYVYGMVSCGVGSVGGGGLVRHAPRIEVQSKTPMQANRRMICRSTVKRSMAGGQRVVVMALVLV